MPSHKLIERRILAVIFILSSSVFFSIMNCLCTIAGKLLPSGEIAFFRVFICLVILTPYLKYKRISLLGKRWGLVFLRGIVGFLALACGFFALTQMPVGEVSVLWKSSVIFTAILSVIVLKEQVTFRLIVLTITSLLGAALILKPSLNVINLAGLAALTAGVLVAVVSVSIRKLHQTEHSETIVYGFCFWGSLLGLILFGNTFKMPNTYEWELLIAIGICGLFGQILFTRAFRYAPASIVQPLTFSEVVFTAIAGALFFNQIPDVLSICGGIAIIISGMGIVIKSKVKDPRPVIIH